MNRLPNMKDAYPYQIARFIAEANLKINLSIQTTSEVLDTIKKRQSDNMKLKYNLSLNEYKNSLEVA